MTAQHFDKQKYQSKEKAHKHNIQYRYTLNDLLPLALNSQKATELPENKHFSVVLDYISSDTYILPRGHKYPH